MAALGNATFRYEERNNKEDFGYEDMFLGYLERLVRDLDRRVERGKERLRRSAQAKQRVRIMLMLCFLILNMLCRLC